MTAPVVLAHQGGWDEALIVLVPVLVLFGLLRLAKRRAERLRQAPGPRPPDRA